MALALHGTQGIEITKVRGGIGGRSHEHGSSLAATRPIRDVVTCSNDCAKIFPTDRAAGRENPSTADLALAVSPVEMSSEALGGRKILPTKIARENIMIRVGFDFSRQPQGTDELLPRTSVVDQTMRLCHSAMPS